MDRPLTDEEVRLFNRCHRMWSEPGFGSSSLKVRGYIRLELRSKLRRLAEVNRVRLDFWYLGGMRYIVATALPKESTTP